MSQQRSFWTQQRQEETMTLPAMAGMQQRSASLVRVSPPAIVPQFPGQTVWIIDDSPTIRAVTRFHLSRLGIIVHPFADGFEALSHLHHFPGDVPPLILVDLELPLMDGYRVVQSLRSLPASAHSTMVIISGHDAALDRLKGRLAGADAYLIKPITYEILLAVACTFLRGRVPQTPARAEESVSYVS